MEKKIKHRILGFTVIAAIIIIAFPFMEKEKGIPSQTAKYVAPPPFPVPASANGMTMQPADTISASSAKPVTVSSPGQTNVIPIVTAMNDKPSLDPNANKQDLKNSSLQDTNSLDANKHDVNQTAMIKPIANPSDTNTTQAKQGDKITFLPPPIKKHDAPVQSTPDNLKHNIEAELFNIKSQIVSNTRQKIAEFTAVKASAWVVQLGVFKEKNNAVRLVNQLRANGYHAFLAKTGETTKVFVGPENKQNAAHMLASRLEQEMHIHGIVVNYKPFTL